MGTLFMTGFSRSSFVPTLGQDIITSYDQGPAAQPVPGIVTTLPATTTPTAQPATDWSKVLSDMIKAGSASYGVYSKAQIEEAALKQKAGLPTGLLPATAPPPSSGISTGTILMIGGVAAALALVAYMASK